MENKYYPEELEDKHFKNVLIFEMFDGNDSYKKDYEDAVKFADKNGGCVYTVIDGHGNNCFYLKGFHFVNRLGYCVIKIKELKGGLKE